jgi:hypothetical protein
MTMDLGKRRKLTKGFSTEQISICVSQQLETDWKGCFTKRHVGGYWRAEQKGAEDE